MKDLFLWQLKSLSNLRRTFIIGMRNRSDVGLHTAEQSAAAATAGDVSIPIGMMESAPCSSTGSWTAS